MVGIHQVVGQGPVLVPVSEAKGQAALARRHLVSSVDVKQPGLLQPGAAVAIKGVGNLGRGHRLGQDQGQVQVDRRVTGREEEQRGGGLRQGLQGQVEDEDGPLQVQAVADFRRHLSQ